MASSAPHPPRPRAWSPPRALLRLAVAGTALALATAAVPASAAPAAAGDPVPPAAVQPGRFVQTDLTRLLDTRNAIGVPTRSPLGGDATLRFAVGQLAPGATAVVLNVTATDTTEESYVTVHPDGRPRPRTSNLNFTPGQTVANLVTVPVTNGYIDIYNHLGSVDLVADVFGYYTDDAAATASTFQPVTPSRALDTRSSGPGGSAQHVGTDGTVNLKLAGRNRVPAAGATAVVLNVTATDTADSSFVTVYPHGTARPSTSNLNFEADQTVPNLVTVPLGADGSIDLYNHIGTADLVVDVFGFYTGAPSGSGFTATGPTRVLDTRDPGRQKVGPGGVLGWNVGEGSGLGDARPSAVVLNVTATGPTATGHLDVYPGGSPRPSSSNLNYTADQTVANTVIVPVDASGNVNFYNNAGSVDVVVDLFGYFTAPQGGPTGLSMDWEYPVACDVPSPGRWLHPGMYSTGFSAVGSPVPGATGPVWTQYVITGPDGTRSYAGPQAAPGTKSTFGVPLADLKTGSAYSWYAYGTDGVHTTAASRPCSFRYGYDPGFRVTISDPGTLYSGQTARFTLSATTDEIEPGFQAATFRYGLDDNSSLGSSIAATGGTATLNLPMYQWGTHTLYVEAVSADGTRTSRTSAYFYVISR
ncbi:hypothetical protein ACIGZJ_11745 [Kitasatospora sp. NPDC052868]|uniref:hypothetical protein n=1 Tax=Kitasatospora sp. NPDC052868 TaxID=3364060 RepID=UPI0037CAB8CC